MKSKKLLLILLTLAMVISLLPASVSAVKIQKDTPNITVNTTKVAFAGQTWWVIGDAESGVYSQDGHITLLAATRVNGSSAVEFREYIAGSRYDGEDGYTQFKVSKDDKPDVYFYFKDNPDVMENWEKPYEYAGSTLQQEMERIADSFSQKEQALITGRDLTEDDGIAGQGISDQKLWALSLDEWNTIQNSDVLDYNANFWWLRTACEGGVTMPDGLEAYISRSSSVKPTDSTVFFSAYYARPALSLDLSSVLFTSTANAAAGKSTAAVGAGLTSAQVAGGRIKFTVVDESQDLTLEVTQGQQVAKVDELKFNYSGATTGENQYVSCVLINKNGVVKYYGKLADSSSAATGEITIPLAGVANGTYTLQIFSEQANGDLYTDFCSEPITYTLTVADGKGTLHVHEWGEPTYTWSEDGTACTASRTCSGDPAHTQKVQATVTGAQTKAPTCTENGETTYTATFTATWASEQTKTVADITSLGHKLTKTPAKDPTCTLDGNTAYWTCEKCGKLFKDANGAEEITADEAAIPATGHGKTDLRNQKDATCTEEGYTGDEVCTVCGEIVKKGEAIPKLDHDYEDGRCTVCGAIDGSFQPAIVKGANGTWQKGAKDGLSFTSNAAYGDFLKVQVDGKDLGSGDYEVREGSTIVTLKVSYLKTLAVGKHTLAIVSETGTASTEFTIRAASTSNTPPTGDGSPLLLWTALLLLSGGVLYAAGRGRKKARGK